MLKNRKIILIEDHHQALDAWRKEAFKSLPLVHLDAHIDFGFYHVKPIEQVMGEAKTIADLKKQLEATLLYKKYRDDIEAQLNIGNYIYPAVRDGIVNKFYWVVPGRSKEFKLGLKDLKSQVKHLRSQDPYKSDTLLYKHYFETTHLFAIPKIEDQILLDIDVDFMLFDSVNNKDMSLNKNVGKRSPWMYPKELVSLVKEKFPQAICITIAYSVNGGFTPIEYKFFGDEIYLRLKDLVDEELEEIFSLRVKGITEALQGRVKTAIVAFEAAVKQLGTYKNLALDCKARFFAHLCFWLFTVHWQLKQKKAAKKYYQKLLKLDPAYRVKDNNLGPIFLRDGKLSAAQGDFEKILYCDSKDPFALCGLGDISFRRKRYKEALIRYKQALRLSPKEKGVLLGVVSSQLKLNQLQEAAKNLAAFKVIDPFNPQGFLLQARLHKQREETKSALGFYKEALMAGSWGMELYGDVFKILKTERDASLLEFFKQKYESYKKDFYKRQKKWLLKSKKKGQAQKLERGFTAIDRVLGSF
ncbi:MAG: UPF0489 family protein [Candidatus Saganbacteria bacterium]|nr:UPF0489 family protein [Candidatus Saganbacteria bacterium]